MRLDVPPLFVVGATPVTFRRIGVIQGGSCEGERSLEWCSTAMTGSLSATTRASIPFPRHADLSTCRMTARSCFPVKGLCRTAEAPSFCAVANSPPVHTEPPPLIAMILTLGFSWRNTEIVSSPSWFGMKTSHRTRSTDCVRHKRSAASPSGASDTSNPAASRHTRTAAKIAGSSSATRIRTV
jgi:hypothetical protein